MAPKRPAPADEQPPPALSSDEEEEASSDSIESEEGEEESSDSDAPKATMQKAPQPKPSSAAPPPRSQATAPKLAPSSESESESESDSDERPIADANLKRQKSEYGEPKRRRAESDSDSDSDVTPVATVKPVESQGARPQSKKLKLKLTDSKKPDAAVAQSSQNAGGEEESSKKQPFQRLWSEEDEITFLEGMIEFWEKRGIDPSTNMNNFYEFIKDRLRLAVVPKQLVNKMKNCKKKLSSNEARANNGKNRMSMTPNEQRIFELSKKLWDSEEGIIREKPVMKSNGTASKKKKTTADQKISTAVIDGPLRAGKDEMATENAKTPFTSATPTLLCEGDLCRFSDGRVNGSFLKRGLNLLSNSKREELEKKWEKLNLTELQLLSDRARLIHEETSLILDAYRTS